MGMFDNLRCLYPLPVEGANEHSYQTKDTPAQFLDNYEIREDGSLWHQDYDIEDHSDPQAEGLNRIIGMMTRVNLRWKQVTDFTGEIRFYYYPLEFSAYFLNGKLQQLNQISKRKDRT